MIQSPKRNAIQEMATKLLGPNFNPYSKAEKARRKKLRKTQKNSRRINR